MYLNFGVSPYYRPINGCNFNDKVEFLAKILDKGILILYLCTKFDIMATKEEVQKFLNQFHVKVNVYDVIVLDGRNKNLQALADLEITSNRRLEVIKSITVEDYSEGPIINDRDNFGDLWVFGKDVNGNEVYIKISLGLPNNKTICISFHRAEHKMSYPFKN